MRENQQQPTNDTRQNLSTFNLFRVRTERRRLSLFPFSSQPRILALSAGAREFGFLGELRFSLFTGRFNLNFVGAKTWLEMLR